MFVPRWVGGLFALAADPREPLTEDKPRHISVVLGEYLSPLGIAPPVEYVAVPLPREKDRSETETVPSPWDRMNLHPRPDGPEAHSHGDHVR